MANIPLQEGETILHQGTLTVAYGTLKVSAGTGYLTNRRLLRIKTSMWQLYFGLIGVLLYSIFNRGDKPDLDTPLTSLQTLARDPSGRNKHLMLLTTRDSQEYKLVLDKFDRWLEALTNALAQNRMQLVKLGEGEWAVQYATPGTAHE